MKKILFISALLLLLSCAACAQEKDIAGDWQGALSVNGAELHLVLHISKNAGEFTATLDSVDQGANGIPVTAVSLKSGEVSFAVDAVHGSYQGKLNANGTVLHGTWTQGQALPLDFKRSASSVKPAAPSDIDGVWQGALDTGTAKLRLVLHITNTADGLRTSMDSVDQNAKGIPATSTTRDGASLVIEFKQIAGKFSGTISKDLTSIDGTWTQQGGTLPLLLKRVKDVAALTPRRPQVPSKPYPYRAEEVSYENKVASIKLAATFTIPAGKGPFPTVLLITGSGPQDRDEAIFGHRPFLVLADYLTRRGIAVLRADDRGFGQSTGNFATATTADFATDTEAGIVYLKTRTEVDANRIGLIGHSEGGVIAPMIAARNPDVAFIVLMAGTAVPGSEILLEQGKLIAEAAGATKEQTEQNAQVQREIFTLVAQEKDDAALETKLREKFKGTLPEAQIKAITSPWFRYFLSYDPAVALSKVKCPVLAINGSKDLQVPPQQNLPVIRKMLASGGNKEFEADELPGLNHLFQTATTGSPSEYSEIEETISPLALAKIGDWIVAHTASAKAA